MKSFGPAGKQREQDEPDEQQEVPVDGAELDARGAAVRGRAPRQALAVGPAERDQPADDVQPVQPVIR